MSLEDALAEACVLMQDGVVTPAATTPRGQAGQLTAREYEVALLMARGFSNRQIADELVIAEKTAKNHVQQSWRSSRSARVRSWPRAGELGLTSG